MAVRSRAPQRRLAALVVLVAEAVRAHVAGLGELERDPLDDDGEREH